VGHLAAAAQEATGGAVEVGFVDQGSTGATPAVEAATHGIRLAVVKLPETQRGFVLLPRRWLVERGFAWTARFRPTNACTRRRRGSTASPSLCSPSKRRSPCSLSCDHVHNRLWGDETVI
jgi:transposase